LAREAGLVPLAAGRGVRVDDDETVEGSGARSWGRKSDRGGQEVIPVRALREFRTRVDAKPWSGIRRPRVFPWYLGYVRVNSSGDFSKNEHTVCKRIENGEVRVKSAHLRRTKRSVHGQEELSRRVLSARPARNEPVANAEYALHNDITVEVFFIRFFPNPFLFFYWSPRARAPQQSPKRASPSSFGQDIYFHPTPE